MAQTVTPLCPACGQTLVLDAADLRASVRCPRCGTIHIAAHLVPPATPLVAIPVSPDPTARATPAPPALQAPTYDATPAPPALQTPTARATPAPPALQAPTYDATPEPPGSVDMSEVAPRASFAHAVLDAADRIDAALYGKRRLLLVVLSFAVTLLAFWEAESTPDDLRWTAIGTFCLALYLEVLLLARIGSFRDDAKRWSAQLVRERLSVFWEDVVESTKAATALPGPAILRGIGSFGAGLAIVILALRNVVVLARVTLAELLSSKSPTLASIDSGARFAGLAMLGLGIVLWLLGLWLSRRGRSAQRLVVHDDERPALAHAAAALPLGVLDCGDAAAIAQLTKATPHPLLAELLVSLSAWKPRNQPNEAGYAASLVRKLRERMPGAPAERERPLFDGKQRFRADIVLGDAVLVEMKRGLSASTAQRALGQVLMYARLWASKGPVLLLICGAPRSTVEALLGPQLGTLRQAGVLVAVSR